MNWLLPDGRQTGSFHLRLPRPLSRRAPGKQPISTRRFTFQNTQSSFIRAASVEYTDISSERNTLTFLSSANTNCKCKVEVSGFCKVEMSKLPCRQMAEAEIGVCDKERKRIATHGGFGRGSLGRRTVASAAIVLAVGVRQIHRLLIRFRENGGRALIYKSRGQPRRASQSHSTGSPGEGASS